MPCVSISRVLVRSFARFKSCLSGFKVIAQLVMIFVASAVLAQNTTTSSSYADQNNPLGPQGLAKPNSVWNVDKATGALSIKIALPTVPKGGRGPKIPVLLQYNSSSTFALSYPATFTYEIGYTGFTQSAVEYYWQSQSTYNNGNPSGGAPFGPWVLNNGPGIYISQASGSFSTAFGTGGVGQTGCQFYGPYLYGDENGQIHDLNLAVAILLSQTQGGPGCPAPNGDVTQGGTLDGSEIQASISGFQPVGSNGLNAGNPGTLSDLALPDGRKFGANGLEDSNGNYTPASLQSYMDSENRPIATISPSGIIGVAARDLNSGTYSVTAGNGSYSINVINLSPSWNFDLPHPIPSEATLVGPLNPGTTINKSLGTLTAVSQISFPDSTQYSFAYTGDNCAAYGAVCKITFPQGGYVRFNWTIRGVGTWVHGINNIAAESTLVVSDVYISDGVNPENHWTYTYDPMDPNTGALVTHETAPDGTITVYTSMPYIYSSVYSDTQPSYQETQRQIIDKHGTTVLYVSTSYSSRGIKPSQVVMTYAAGGVQKQVNYQYDTHWNETEKDESDFYSCSAPTPCTNTPPLLRKTLTAYAWNSNSALASAYIVNLPSQVTVTDGAENFLSQAQYTYDDFAVASLPNNAKAVNHDDQKYPATVSTGRGNLTTEKHCVAFSSGSCSQWLTTTYHYDLTGQMVSKMDPRGNLTTYSYTDSYSNGSCVANGSPCQTNAYLTDVLAANGAHDDYSYDYVTGNLTSHSDWNQQVTSYGYSDSLNRITVTNYPDGGGTGIQYTDTPNAVTIQKTTTTGEAAGPIVETTSYDGLGRPIQDATTSISPSLTTYTTYDNMGRVQSNSSPMQPSGNPSTDGYTAYTYDALGRKRLQCQPDNGTAKTACAAGNSYLEWQYTGNITDVYDEARNHSQQTVDGLGRLTKVLEPDPASNALSFETDYQYDGLSNLLGVNQKGSPGSGDTARVRSFTYDGLSRLLTSMNKENGGICYGTGTVSSCGNNGYDGNGNLVAKTDARGITTNYTYDNVDHLISKTYTGEVNPTLSSCFQYGGSGAASTNSVGRLTSEWTQPGACSTSGIPSNAFSWSSISSYDQMGRLGTETQCASAPCLVPSTHTYFYDKVGNITHFDNGLASSQSPQIAFTNAFDGGGRLLSLTSTWVDSTHPDGLFQNPAYGPFGLTMAQLGFSSTDQTAALAESYAYDTRGRITSINDLGSTAPPPPNPITLTLDPLTIAQGVEGTITAECGSGCGSGTGAFYVDGAVMSGGGFSYSPNVPLLNYLISSSLGLGQHTLQVILSGDATHPSQSSQIITFTVGPNTLSVPVLTISFNPNPIPYPESADVTVTSSCGVQCSSNGWSPNGDLTSPDIPGFKLGLWFDNNGIAQTQLPANVLAARTYNFVASYYGNATNSNSQTTQAVTVVNENLPAPQITITPVSTPIYSDQYATFNVVFPCGAHCRGGNFLVDGNYAGGYFPDSNGNAQITLSPGLSPNQTHTLEVDYPGDTTYAPGKGTLQFNVTSIVSLSIDPLTIAQGVRASITAECGSGCGTGSGYFYLDGAIMSGGGFSYSPNVPLLQFLASSAMSFGQHTVQVIYSGDATHASQSSQIITFEVAENHLPAPTLTISFNPNPIPNPESADVTVTAACGAQCNDNNWNLNGDLTSPDIPGFESGLFFDGNGIAQTSLPSGLSAGTYNIVATYYGNGTNSNSQTTQAVTVVNENLPTPQIAITPTSTPIYSDQYATFNVVFPCGAHCRGGNFLVDGNYAGGYFPDSNGNAQITLLPGLSITSHTLSVSYPGDANYAPATANYPFTPTQDTLPVPTITMTPLSGPLPVGQLSTLSFNITSTASSPCGGGANLLLNGGYNNGLLPDSNGNASVGFTPPSAGSFTLSLAYLGSTVCAPATASFPLQAQ